jgi:hypothetical protein
VSDGWPATQAEATMVIAATANLRISGSTVQQLK